ncbi:hypothetical protein H0I76_19260, partial [Limibaculum sp. M0105]
MQYTFYDGTITPAAITAGTSALGYGIVIINSGSYSTQKVEIASNTAVYGSVGLVGFYGPTTVNVRNLGVAGSTGEINVAVDSNYGYGILLVGPTASLISTNTAFWNGSTVVGGYSNLNIGVGATTYGIAGVYGAGASLETNGTSPAINIGHDDGTGYLSVFDNAEAGTLDLDVGRNGDGGLGIDTGGLVTVGNDSGFFGNPANSGLGGRATFGSDSGYGFLNMYLGGSLAIENADGQTDHPTLTFGLDEGSYGYANIRDNGTSVSVIQSGAAGDDFDGGASVRIGAGGSAVVIVQTDAMLSVLGDGAYLGVATGDGLGGPTTSDESRLRILSGADVLVDAQGYSGEGSAAKVIIGGVSGGDGDVLVNGAGSTLTIDSSGAAGFGGLLIVGGAGEGTLAISDGGLVQNIAPDGVTEIGSDPAGNGTATVTGAASRLDAGKLLLIGAAFDAGTETPQPQNGGEGALNLVDGSTVSASTTLVGS